MSKLLRSITFLLLMAAFAQFAAAQTVVNVPTCNSVDLQTALNTVAADNVIINLPAGTCTWTNTVLYTQIFSITIQGATTCSGSPATSCTDNTVIIDNLASTNPLLNISTNAPSFRLTGVTFQGGTGSVKQNGVVAIGGNSHSVRVDHNHINIATYNPSNSSIGLRFTGWIYGVVDHNVFDDATGRTSEGINVWMDGYNGSIHGSWADDTALGSSKFLYVEDNSFNNGIYADDCDIGARQVVRYNIINNAQLQTHPTGSSGTAFRGCRAKEIYHNTFNGNPNCNSSTNFSLCLFNAYWLSSGTGVVWGNTITYLNSTARSGYQYLITAHSMRRDNSTYSESPTPKGWGYCGPTPLANGTVNVSGTTVTWVSGDQFATSWPAGSMINIAGLTCTRTSKNCRISAVSSATSLALQTSSNQTLTNVTYQVGSGWDSNADGNGGACLDQPGRGKGDLLVGEFPSVINSKTGTISWPNQALEPIYEWGDSLTPVPSNPGGIFLSAASAFIQNTDYYIGNPSFNGATGVGSGLLSARPTTCTPLVAYWATDTTTLYQCSSPNTWTTYYKPYTYPHPLVSGGGGAKVPPSPPTLLQVTIS